jgi:DNA-binding transcriptional ArsR family regulator
MARAATTTDAFNAVAEPRRRQILDAIAGRELSVTELVRELGLPQPLVSKHLRVLRETGLVVARDDGRQRMYRLNGPALRPIYDWVRDFEQLWTERFARMDAVVAELGAAEPAGRHEDRTRTEDER